MKVTKGGKPPVFTIETKSTFDPVKGFLNIEIIFTDKGKISSKRFFSEPVPVDLNPTIDHYIKSILETEYRIIND